MGSILRSSSGVKRPDAASTTWRSASGVAIRLSAKAAGGSSRRVGRRRGLLARDRPVVLGGTPPRPACRDTRRRGGPGRAAGRAGRALRWSRTAARRQSRRRRDRPLRSRAARPHRPPPAPGSATSRHRRAKCRGRIPRARRWPRSQARAAVAAPALPTGARSPGRSRHPSSARGTTPTGGRKRKRLWASRPSQPAASSSAVCAASCWSRACQRNGVPRSGAQPCQAAGRPADRADAAAADHHRPVEQQNLADRIELEQGERDAEPVPRQRRPLVLGRGLAGEDLGGEEVARPLGRRRQREGRRPRMKRDQGPVVVAEIGERDARQVIGARVGEGAVRLVESRGILRDQDRHEQEHADALRRRGDDIALLLGQGRGGVERDQLVRRAASAPRLSTTSWPSASRPRPGAITRRSGRPSGPGSTVTSRPATIPGERVRPSRAR